MKPNQPPLFAAAPRMGDAIPAQQNILAKHDIEAVEDSLIKELNKICGENPDIAAGAAVSLDATRWTAARAWIANYVCQTNHNDNKTISDIADELWDIIQQFEEDQEKRPPYGLPALQTLLTDTSELKLKRHKLYEQRFNPDKVVDAATGAVIGTGVPEPYEEAVPKPIALITHRIKRIQITKITDGQLRDVLSQFRKFVNQPNDVLDKELFKLLDSTAELRDEAEILDQKRFQAFKHPDEHGESGWLHILEVNEEQIMELTRLRNLKAQCEKDIEEIKGA